MDIQVRIQKIAAMGEWLKTLDHGLDDTHSVAWTHVQFPIESNIFICQKNSYKSLMNVLFISGSGKSQILIEMVTGLIKSKEVSREKIKILIVSSERNIDSLSKKIHDHSKNDQFIDAGKFYFTLYVNEQHE